MQAQLIDIQEPVLAKNSTATWCQHCKKFRYPYCSLNSKFYCSSCAEILGLRAVQKDRGLSPSVQSSRRLKTSLPDSQSDQCRVFLGSTVLALLKQHGPQSSLELSLKIGCSQETVIIAARTLRESGRIVSSRQKTYPPYLWFALPKDKPKFSELIPLGLKDKLLKELENKPLLYLELCERLPEYSNSSVAQSLTGLIKEKLILRNGYDHYRYYGLPKDAKLVKELSTNPKKQKILQFVINNPGLHGREISRRVTIESTRTRSLLIELERETRIKSKWDGHKKLFFAV